MAPGLKETALRAAKAAGLFGFARRLTADRLRILCYHGIWLAEGQPNPFNFLYMQPGRFARRLDLLRAWGYPVLPLGEALQRLDHGTLPPAAVAITIDDGWYGSYRHMVPELVRRGLPATIYLTTYHAEKQTAVFGVALQYLLQTGPQRTLDCARLPLPFGGRVDLDDATAREEVQAAIRDHAAAHLDAAQHDNLLGSVAEALGTDWPAIRDGRFFHLMSLDEAAQCAAQGIDFQLHTHRHRVTAGGKPCIAEEIAANRARLAAVTATAATHFCYPSGEWEPEHLPHLRAAGVVSATTTDNGLCAPGHERLALPRILDGDRVSELEFEAELSGFMEIKRLLAPRARRKTTAPRPT
ncbi:polysaccharide deacetylase family protein [Pseudothauera rhizosphaerae]|uniref:Polysaccharide deacetylase family protein n=1 Tax=Pseudothauera rhizosphaerae TaxID=2565932 RepID=A0A4S4APL6_9RHOO|nr:polysaccharide deacetylase family protein [Pseudothauera rhizosphaerae]THF61618.1 polysaccharide deacetylase family protein [Pseudothauera rhizosphaerae]